MAYEAVLDALEKFDLMAPSWGETKAARCPAHDDTRASLSLKEGSDGRALLYCHAGCDVREVVEALGLTMADLFGATEDSAVVATYEYLDESAQPVMRVLRLSPKGFFQERWEEGEWKPKLRDETRRVLYHLDRLVRLPMDETVYVVEGEKDADNIIDQTGAFATTVLGGAGKWRDEYLQYFTDRRVVIVADLDKPDPKTGRLPGQEWAEKLASIVAGVAASVTIRHPAVGKDVTTHLLAGLTLDQLVVPQDDSVFEPWDPDEYEGGDEEWLWAPYVPRAGRILVYGASGSLKSLWAAWIGAHIAAEGGKVAYFSLEMNKRQYAKRWKQLKHIDFPKENYQTYGSFMFGMNLETAIKCFEGYDLLIIDSWSQAQGQMGANDNDAISMMDADYFQPLIAATGASVMIIDNTGKDGRDNEGRKVKNDEARGASRKKDIQEVAWWLSRPDEGNNFRTRIACRKMRLDLPMPSPVTVETPQDRIEFYRVEGGLRTEQPFWEEMQVENDGAFTETDSGARSQSVPETTTTPASTPGPSEPGPNSASSAEEPAYSSEQEALEEMILALGSPAEKRQVRIERGKRRLEETG